MRRVTSPIESRSERTAENAKNAERTILSDLCDLRGFFWTSVCLIAAATLSAQAPAPKRIKRAIELLEQGQPISRTPAVIVNLPVNGNGGRRPR